MFRTFGLSYPLWDLLHQMPKSTVNTFDGTDPKADRIKPKVRNTIFSPCDIRALASIAT